MNIYARNLKRLSVLGIIFILLAGCQAQTTPALPATVPPATPIPTQVPSSGLKTISADLVLDPALAQDADSLMICQYLYEGLVRLDDKGEPAAGLAESWVISDDQLDYIFTLRAGMTFSDGSPITPDVVVANFNRWFDPQDSLHGAGDYTAWKDTFLGFHGEKDANDLPISPVDGIQKVDQTTVLIHLNRPMPELLTSLAQPAFAILDPDALTTGSYGGRESTIVASGPYTVKAWTDAELQLSPNPNYWGEAPTQDLTFGLSK